MAKEKIILAYSGGLDTSVILKWLQQTHGYDVIAVAIDVGQGEQELQGLTEKALATGAVDCKIVDAKAEFAKDYLLPMVKSGATYEGQYLLGTSIARPLIAEKLVAEAKNTGASAIAHGATGKGNDQVRFELTIKALAPHLRIIAPWREWTIQSRQEAIAYAKQHKIPITATADKPYSIDSNLWHTSYEGGILENLDCEPNQEMFLLTNSIDEAPAEALEIEISWEKGIPVALNGFKMEPLELIQTLNKLGGQHAIGRIDLLENRLIGIKSRGIYETPAGTILYFAHREMEHLCLDKDTLHFKEQMALKYGELIYNGLWFTPLREAISSFIDHTQLSLWGKIKLSLYKGHILTKKRQSQYSLYDDALATFEADDLYNQKDAEGFINLYGLPLKMAGIQKRAMQKKEATQWKNSGAEPSAKLTLHK